MPIASGDNGANQAPRPDGSDGGKTPGIGEALREVRDEAVAAGAEIGRTARNEALAAVDRGRETIADRLDHVVLAIEASARELEGSEARLANATGSIAARLRSAATHLHNQDARALAGEASDLARSYPLAFLLGSVAIGFAAARMAKAVPPGEQPPEQMS